MQHFAIELITSGGRISSDVFLRRGFVQQSHDKMTVNFVLRTLDNFGCFVKHSSGEFKGPTLESMRADMGYVPWDSRSGPAFGFRWEWTTRLHIDIPAQRKQRLEKFYDEPLVMELGYFALIAVCDLLKMMTHEEKEWMVNSYGFNPDAIQLRSWLSGKGRHHYTREQMRQELWIPWKGIREVIRYRAKKSGLSMGNPNVTDIPAVMNKALGIGINHESYRAAIYQMRYRYMISAGNDVVDVAITGLQNELLSMLVATERVMRKLPDKTYEDENVSTDIEITYLQDKDQSAKKSTE